MQFRRAPQSLLAVIGFGGLLAAAHAGCSTTPSFLPDGTNAASSGSGGTDCKTVDDCIGDENECVHRTCTAGKCGTDESPEGFLVSAQTMGDCQKAVCDGKGAVTTVPDESDTPNDGNACTIDLCTNGKPSHPPSSKGTACGATQELTCDGAGNCAGCKGDAECGSSTPCTKYSCIPATSTCAIGYVPAGMGDPGNQQAGDCKKNVCNGAGNTAVEDDDSDVPNDGNACTTDTCSMGTPSHSPAPVGTSCGAFKCNGMGSCAGCVSDSDCGQDNACASFSCSAGACQSTYIPSGQGDPGGQVAGDCKKNVCNGSGSPTSIPDDTDIPNDNNVCTTDTCSNGVPDNTPLASGTTCGGTQKCDGAGHCEGCLTDADCGASTSCINKLCQSGQCATENVPNGTSCGGINICDGNGACVCNDPNACTGKCGSFNNACSVPVSCPACTAPETCGGAGAANVCGCTPKPNPCPVNQCAGTAPDGCGGTVACTALCDDICPCLGTCSVTTCICKPVKLCE